MVTHGPLTSYMNQINDAEQLTELIYDVNIASRGREKADGQFVCNNPVFNR